MAVKKKAKKAVKKVVTKAVRKTPAKAAKTVRPSRRPVKPSADPAPTQPDAPASAGSASGLRVRMFRVGFGDFFLVTVPTPSGAKHILIDCGVHHKDAHSITAAAQQMAQDCGNELALLIMTHRHADHISGFATCADVFKKIAVERVWMSWFEDPHDKDAAGFQASLTALAGQLGQALTLRLAEAPDDERTAQLKAMAENITGANAAAGGGANQAALDVLHGGFRNTPAYDYYRAGDTPTLPPDLAAAGMTALILGPPADRQLVNSMRNANQEYLAATEDAGDDRPTAPFARIFRCGADDYPKSAFELFDADRIAKMVDVAQPDLLAAQAASADKTLNNQSLVVHFSVLGKNLLFVGDAQWGNWENFLYGGAYGPGRTELTAQAKAILGKIDFYKVGHHGSTNATPKDAVAAMRSGCVGMCSTEENAYNEVPRGPLLAALSERMKGQLARSDQVAVKDEAVADDAGHLPSDFKAGPGGFLYIDYSF